MSELLKKEREFVVPGDEIVKSMDFLPGRNCFRAGDAIVSKKIGLVSLSGRVISVIPFNGPYMPRVGDMVIATVEDIQGDKGWLIDVGAPYNAFLPLAGVREFIDTNRTKLSSVFAMGDVLYAKIHSVHLPDHMHISMQDPRARKLRGGRVIKINASKVPRIIGKQGSMISMIKDRTGSRISIGQNGLLWLDGGDNLKVLEAIKMIDEGAYKNGLTDKVSKLLGEPKVKPVVKPVEAKPVVKAVEAKPVEKPVAVKPVEEKKEAPKEEPKEEQK